MFAVFSLLMRVSAEVAHSLTQIVLLPELTDFCTAVMQLVRVAVDCEAVFACCVQSYDPGCDLGDVCICVCVYICM